jgi:ribonuclease D
MLKYAREDTHYLLKIYDHIMEDLEKRVNSTRLIDIVKKKSNQITQLKKFKYYSLGSLITSILSLKIFDDSEYKPGPIPDIF